MPKNGCRGIPEILKGTWVLQWKGKFKLGLATWEAVHLGWQSQEDTHTENTAAIEGRNWLDQQEHSTLWLPKSRTNLSTTA